MKPPDNDETEISYDDEDTTITDTQPISKVLNGLTKTMQEHDELCHQMTMKIQALKLGQATTAGGETSRPM